MNLIKINNGAFSDAFSVDWHVVRLITSEYEDRE